MSAARFGRAYASGDKINLAGSFSTASASEEIKLIVGGTPKGYLVVA